MALEVERWMDDESDRLRKVLFATKPPLSFENIEVSKPKVVLWRATQKARRVATKLGRRS